MAAAVATSMNVAVNGRANETRVTASKYALPLLLTTSMFINYIDRSNLSIAAPLMQKDMGLTTAQIGVLSSAFFWTYALFQLVGISGWLCDRFRVTMVFGISALVWGLSTLVTGFLSSFWAIFAMRLILGAGESFAYPCYSRILATDVPQTSRGTANAFLDAASKLGPSVGMFLGGMLLVRFDWRIFFVVLGVISLAWVVPWFLFAARSSSSPINKPVSGGSVARILSSRSAWGTFAGHFCGNYVWFFLLIWLPSYLVKDKGLSTQAMANVGSIAFLVIAIGTLCAGWLSDRYIRRGVSPTIVRKSVVVGGLLGSASILVVGYVQSASFSLAMLLFACFAFGTYTSNHWAITQTIAGPAMAGRWTGLQNGIGNFSGIVASWLTGELATQTGSFRTSFVMTGLIALAGACMWGIVVGPVRELPVDKES
ncbi:MAG TPA: MFS transporter [Terriglobales bacterium]|nr:MFS transporter [Terriglobales bacterium]